MIVIELPKPSKELRKESKFSSLFFSFVDSELRTPLHEKYNQSSVSNYKLLYTSGTKFWNSNCILENETVELNQNKKSQKPPDWPVALSKLCFTWR